MTLSNNPPHPALLQQENVALQKHSFRGHRWFIFAAISTSTGGAGGGSYIRLMNLRSKSLAIIKTLRFSTKHPLAADAASLTRIERGPICQVAPPGGIVAFPFVAINNGFTPSL